MKKILFAFIVFCTGPTYAQQFISSGKIEFEVRTNNYKIYGDGIFGDMFKDKYPQFSTNYYDFTFNNNKAIYKFGHRDEKSKLPWDNNNYADDNVDDYSYDIYVSNKDDLKALEEQARIFYETFICEEGEEENANQERNSTN